MKTYRLIFSSFLSKICDVGKDKKKFRILTVRLQVIEGSFDLIISVQK